MISAAAVFLEKEMNHGISVSRNPSGDLQTLFLFKDREFVFEGEYV
jgi:hypothetical protein